jgi:hypothetical protein
MLVEEVGRALETATRRDTLENLSDEREDLQQKQLHVRGERWWWFGTVTRR